MHLRGAWIAVAGVSLALAPAVGAQGVRIGTRAPEIDVRTLDGIHIQLSDLRGHPVVVTFWASWCPPCRDEFPALADAYHRYTKRGLRIIAVNERDQERSDADIRKFLEEFPVPFPVGIDKRGRSRRDYQLIGLPAMMFIDSAGVIRQILWGPHSVAELDRSIALIIPVAKAPLE